MADFPVSIFDVGPKVSVRRSRRVRTPTILQMEVVECGAACLAMILAHYGKWVPLDQMRRDCGVSRDGSKASYMVKAARNHGMIANAVRTSPETLKTVPFPVIVFWQLDHFVVVEGYDKKGWYLNDPAVGPRTVDHDQFDKSFTGICLTFTKGPGFVKGGHRPSVVRSLWSRAQGVGAAICYAVLAGLCLTVIGLVIPCYLKVYVDHYLIGRDTHWLKPLLWIMLLTPILQVAIGWLQQNVILRLNTKLALSMSAQFFHHLLRLPIEFYAQRYCGEVQSRLALNDRVAVLLTGQLSGTILNCMTAVFFVIVMAQYSLLLTSVGVLGSLLNLAALSFVARKRTDLNQRLLQEQGKLMGVSMSGLASIETVKSNGSEPDMFRRWAGFQAQVVNSTQNLALWSSALNMVPALVTSAGLVAVMGIGGLRVMQGYLTIGDLIAFQSLMASFVAPINSLVGLGSQLQEVQGSLLRLDDVLGNKTDTQLTKTEALQLPPGTSSKLRGKVELRDVSFVYGVFDKSFIEKLNLTIGPGSRVALVGASGCGKTTVANMVAGLYAPTDGEILFDGKQRSEIPRSVMANSLAKVDQDILLFEGTIRDNIVLWNKTIADEVMVQAAKDACIHEDIVGRPGGYEGPVLEGGQNFSGGQRQRMEIARALALEPTVIILDEATSALDTVTEHTIDENLRRRGCTCLIAAHRLSTIRDSDEILVFQAGKVVERGSHEELIGLNGYYAQLVQDS